MPVPTFDQFKALLRKSGAVDPERLDRAIAAFSPAADEKDPTQAFVRFLLARKLLTLWQSEQLLRGKSQLCLGPYRLLGRLGSGGMSTVFAAEHTGLRRQVAIKVLPKDHTNRPNSLERFMREAQVISQCNHPNVVQAYDVDNVSGVYFIVLERVEGRDLEKVVRADGPLTAERAAEFTRQAAEGLAHIHSKGVVHRDVKPSNLLLDGSGVVKLTDLGVALLTLDESGSRTNKQTTLGTTEYMAPEQALDSHNIDERADLYSLGCTLYYLLTGTAPFVSRSMAETLLGHQHYDAKPISVCREELSLPEAPVELIAICDKLMAKKPAERYQSADEVATALVAYQNKRAARSSSRVGPDTPTESWTRRPSASSSTKLQGRTGEGSAGSKLRRSTETSTTAADSSTVVEYDTPDARPLGRLTVRDGGGVGVKSNSKISPVAAPAAATIKGPTIAAVAEPFDLPTSAAAKPLVDALAQSSPDKLYLVGGAASAALLLLAALWASGMFSGSSAADAATQPTETPPPVALSEPTAEPDAAAAPPAPAVASTAAPLGASLRFVDGKAPPMQTAPGRVDRALVADGATGLVFEGQPAFDPKKLTVECWLRATAALPDDQTSWVVAKNNNQSSVGHYSIVLQGSKIAAILNPTGAAEPIHIVSDVLVTTDAWRHAALVDNGQTAKLYVDGRLAGSANLPAPRQPTSGPLAIGVRPDRAVPPTAGVLIDEVRISNRALTSDEVSFRAQRDDWIKSQVATEGLVAAWNFDALRLENPSFEQEGLGWSIHTGSLISSDPTKVHNGTKCVHLSQGQTGGETRLTGLTAGALYTYCAWVRCESPDASIGVGIKEYGGRELTEWVTSSEWTSVVIPFTVQDQDAATIYFWKKGGGDAYFDDVTVFQGAPDPASLNQHFKFALGPVMVVPPATPPDPALSVDTANRVVHLHCGDWNFPETTQRDGYLAHLYRVIEAADWPEGASRRYYWSFNDGPMEFAIQTPPKTAGVLRMTYCDGDRQARKQRVSVAGRDVGEVSDFGSPKQLTVAVTPEMTTDGFLKVATYAIGPGLPVVSEVEFFTTK